MIEGMEALESGTRSRKGLLMAAGAVRKVAAREVSRGRRDWPTGGRAPVGWVLSVLFASLLATTRPSGAAAQSNGSGEGTCDPGPSSLVFTLLVIYFFATVGSVLMLFLVKQLGESGSGRLGPVGGSQSKTDKKNLEEPVPRPIPRMDDGQGDEELESWQIPYNELRFGKVVGKGNVGEVYEAKWRGVECAVKKLLGNWHRDEEMVERFRDEILMLSTCRHNNVLRFVGAVLDVNMGNLCLVTELCVGSLEDVVHSDQKLGWGQRLKFMTGICEGMHYLHRRAGIIQRDLKSANVLIDDMMTPKIADFGLSRYMPDRVTDAMTTYCGTPATMAPEIYQQKDYSAKADVFSFSIIMWEILTREEPYGRMAKGGLRLAHMVAVEGLRPPIPSYCPREWADLMQRMWDVDEHKRPDFDEILDLIQPWVSLVDERLRRKQKLATMKRQASAKSMRGGFGAAMADRPDTIVEIADEDGGSVTFNPVLQESKASPMGASSPLATSSAGGSGLAGSGIVGSGIVGSGIVGSGVMGSAVMGSGFVSGEESTEEAVARVLDRRGKVRHKPVYASPFVNATRLHLRRRSRSEGVAGSGGISASSRRARRRRSSASGARQAIAAAAAAAAAAATGAFARKGSNASQHSASSGSRGSVRRGSKPEAEISRTIAARNRRRRRSLSGKHGKPSPLSNTRIHRRRSEPAIKIPIDPEDNGDRSDESGESDATGIDLGPGLVTDDRAGRRRSVISMMSNASSAYDGDPGPLPSTAGAGAYQMPDSAFRRASNSSLSASDRDGDHGATTASAASPDGHRPSSTSAQSLSASDREVHEPGSGARHYVMPSSARRASNSSTQSASASDREPTVVISRRRRSGRNSGIFNFGSGLQSPRQERAASGASASGSDADPGTPRRRSRGSGMFSFMRRTSNTSGGRSASEAESQPEVRSVGDAASVSDVASVAAPSEDVDTAASVGNPAVPPAGDDAATPTESAERPALGVAAQS